MKNETENIIEIENLHHTYPDGTKAIRGINLGIKKGEKLVVMGENGSGKSSLFLHLNGVLRPTQGTVKVQGREIDYSRKGLLEVRKKVGIVFQNPDNQLFSASVFQEISFGVLNLGYSQAESREKVDKVIESLKITPFKEKPTHFLSGGQKKRVAIADVVVMEPDVIIFDEPTAELDPYHAQRIDEVIDELVEQGITVILSTHNVARALSFADRIILLHQGQLVGDGNVEKIFMDRELLKTTHLEVPKVIRIFETLVENSVLPGGLQLPRTVEDLDKYIKEYAVSQ